MIKVTACMLLFLPMAILPQTVQRNYPWGHQLLNLFCNLSKADPEKAPFTAGVGSYVAGEKHLPVTGAERSLIKAPFFSRFEIDRLVAVELLWDILYHSEAGRPYRWNPGDLRFYTTFYLMSSPWVAIKTGTKLPNAPNNYQVYELSKGGGLSGAGSDMEDFHMLLLVSQTLNGIGLHANVGFLIMGDPTYLSNQVENWTLASGADHTFGKLNLLLEANASIGHRRFDHYRTVGLTAAYEILPWLRLSVKGLAGLSESTDDYQTEMLLIFRK